MAKQLTRATTMADGAPAELRYDDDVGVIQIAAGAGDVQYEVAIDEVHNSASVLDWIIQVSQKTWASDAMVGALVRMMDELLLIQDNGCGGGQDHEFDAKDILERWKKRRG